MTTKNRWVKQKMGLQAQPLNSSPVLISRKFLIPRSFSSAKLLCNSDAFHFRKDFLSCGMRKKGIAISAAHESNGNAGISRKRKIVEHICLLKANDDLSDQLEKDMLDYLYTTQYQMRGIVAISLGRVSDQQNANYTHAIFMRFQKKEDLVRFYDNPFYAKVLTENVLPNCHDIVNVDYESEVEDDILPIFRKGEEFNFGVEFVLLIAFDKQSLERPAEEAMTALANLTTELPSLIVQATKGAIFNPNDAEYTHAIVIRFRSSEAFKMFIKSSEYNNIWGSKIQPIMEKAMSVHFSVDPVGTELM